VSGYDIIGDIHGCGEKLNGLLDLLGWEAGADGLRWHPSPTRKVIFVGDLIDRGTAQQQALETVRSMVDAGTARIVMGNHEFNAISYATEIPGRPGHFLREHSDKNYQQHKAFLEHLTEAEQASWVEWFKTLPMWLDLEDEIGRIRIVHACWHQDSIDVLERELGGSLLPEGFADLAAANDTGDPIGEAIEVVLKGPEIDLAEHGLPKFKDKSEIVRGHARIRWWMPDPKSLRDLIVLPTSPKQADGTPYPPIPDTPCSPEDARFSYADVVPVVYGHHWRSWEPDEHLDWTKRTACVDFSTVLGGAARRLPVEWRTRDRPDALRAIPGGGGLTGDRTDMASHSAYVLAERLLQLIDEGRRTATYKLASFLALMDACAEEADVHGRAPETLHSRVVAQHVLRLYKICRRNAHNGR
jgi:hypothetical protein